MPLKQSSFNFDFVEEETASPKNQEVVTEVLPVEVKETEIRVIETFVKKETVASIEQKKHLRGRVKLKNSDSGYDRIDIPDDKVLFEKSYYSIGIVSEMFKVNQSLIRYWANEFDSIKPKTNKKGDRFFRPEDVKNLKLIYQLLRERKYTIEGAKEFLKKSKHAEAKFAMMESLQQIKLFLNEIKANL